MMKEEFIKRICGFRPSDKLHLGHYFSVIKPAIDLDCDVLIADLHVEGKVQPDLITETYRLLEKYGISKVILQSEIFDYQHYFKLSQTVNYGKLTRLPSFKSSKIKTMHKLMYPVMMAVDICKYHEVLVGIDQAPHIEFANQHLRRKIKYITSGIQIQDFKIPERKMSKSFPEGCIFLSDSEDVIYEKCFKMSNTIVENMCVLFDTAFNEKNMKKSKSNIAEKIIKTIKP